MEHSQKATGCNALAFETQVPMKKRTKLKAEKKQMRCGGKATSTQALKIIHFSDDCRSQKHNSETDSPFSVASYVSFLVLTQALCCPCVLLSPHLPPVGANKGFPVASPVQQHKRTVCAPVCPNRQWSSCADCQLSERATLFHL